MHCHNASQQGREGGQNDAVGWARLPEKRRQRAVFPSRRVYDCDPGDGVLGGGAVIQCWARKIAERDWRWGCGAESAEIEYIPCDDLIRAWWRAVSF